MPRSTTLSFLSLAFTLSACRAETTTDAGGTPARPRMLAGVGENETFQFDLTLTPDPPIVGELFRVVTRIREVRTEMPVSGADFDLAANMPEHGHGMNTVPQHQEQHPGDYLSEGMKFHMPGSWAMTARVSKANVTDRITLRFEQPPRFR